MKIVELIVSGGQTGADQGGLLAARDLGIPTAGWAPSNYMTENGPMPDLLSGFGLRPWPGKGYPPRTRANVCQSDATVIFGNIKEPGSRLTFAMCNEYGVPVCVISGPGAMSRDDVEGLRKWIVAYRPRTLNVAGNRESKNPGICEAVRKFLVEVLKESSNGY